MRNVFNFIYFKMEKPIIKLRAKFRFFLEPINYEIFYVNGVVEFLSSRDNFL